MPEPQRRCAKCGTAYGAAVTFCPEDGAPVITRPLGFDPSHYVGLAVRDDLTLTELLGVGAMASVFRARQSGVERDVAVKVLHLELAPNAMLVARFAREGRAAARLRHPNVVEVIAAGTLPDSAGDAAGVPYLALEYLDGLTLRSALAAAGGRLDLERALHVVLQVCEAMAAAHALDIVHRDLKPENLMLVRRSDDADFVKVLDFGLSRLAESEGGFETHAGAVLGTARYVSPEGARGEAVTASADVYAIATVLFECLAGKTPFEGDNALAVLVQKAAHTAPDLRSIEGASAVPAPIAELLAQALAKEPSARPADARVFGQALVRAALAAGLGARELSRRPTLFGVPAASLSGAEATRQLGSPAVEISSAAEPGARERSRRAGNPRRASPAATKRAGIVAACFGLGALGALGVATQLGSCGRTWP